jgi:uncharacterized membrane protein YphA (DoxX/SURF4 family)
MGAALLACRLGLAAVFATAGLAKLADLEGSRSASREFGVPAPIAAAFGTLLPLAELATAAALIPNASARWGALAALVLLLGFIGGISNALARGREPDCHCFGQVHSEPASWKTLARNIGLGGVAAFVLAAG